MQQSFMYCGTVLPATRQMLATSNVCGVDAAVRHVLWYGVTCHLADAGDEQCLRCGCSSPSCIVVFCAADIGKKSNAKQESAQVTTRTNDQERIDIGFFSIYFCAVYSFQHFVTTSILPST